MKINPYLLKNASERAIQYLKDLNERNVFPNERALKGLTAFDFPLGEEPTSAEKIIELLDQKGSPATVTSTGGRYYGFVNGGTLPVTIATQFLAAAWDQNVGMRIMSPVAAKLEEVASKWLLDIFELPSESGVGFVTGATMANFSALAAARHILLKRKGWNVEANGLFGAPELTVIVGDDVHVSPMKGLSLLGLGTDRVIRIPVDEQGRIRPELMPSLNDSTIILLQAGNVNSGAVDPFLEICKKANASGAWVHVDAAFGMWAAASEKYSSQLKGIELADSWATDLHKWLNVPYDSGVVICKNRDALRAAMSVNADYLEGQQEREPCSFTPEMSRRARGLEAYTALYSLGKKGLADLVERCCEHAVLFSKKLKAAGFEILNDVNLNQVLVSFGTDQMTEQVIAEIQKDRTCWCGGTKWKGRHAMRISVSSWATTGEDVDRSVRAMVRIANQVRSRKARTPNSIN